VPAHNCENTIEKCLLSLIAQTYGSHEIIVVDDCSADKTPEIVRRLSEKYGFKCIRLPKKSGQGAARNGGTKYATGDIIFEAEADAYYAPNYIELCIKHLENPRVGTVVGALHAWPDSSLWYIWWETKRRITLYNYKVLGGWFFRKSNLEEVGPYRESLKSGEDVELCLRLRRQLGLEFAYEPEALWYHRYPYSFWKILLKAFKRGKGIIEFNRVIGVHGRILARSVIYVTLVVMLLYSFLQGIITHDLRYLVLPLVTGFLAFAYPVYQLRSRRISLREFKEYVMCFPFVQGLETLFFSIGYISGLLGSQEKKADKPT